MLSEKLKRFHDLCQWSTPEKVLAQNELVEEELEGAVWVGSRDCDGTDKGVDEYVDTLTAVSKTYEQMESSWEILRARFPELNLPDFEEV